MSTELRPLVDGVKDNKKHWLELAQTAQETIKNRKNSLKSMSNGSTINNNYFTNGNKNIESIAKNNNNNTSINNNNNNSSSGDELSNTSSDSSIKMSKIVGKFPLDIASVNSLFTPTYIKPSQNGFIYKPPSIVRYESWMKKDGEQVMDQ
jgi:hypothetical protein